METRSTYGPASSSHDQWGGPCSTVTSAHSGDPGTGVGRASTLRNLSAREEEATPAPAGSAMARSVGERVAASHLPTVQLPLCILAMPAQAAIPPGGPPLWVGAPGEGRCSPPALARALSFHTEPSPRNPDESESVLVVCPTAQPRTYFWPMTHRRARAGTLRERLVTLRRDTRKTQNCRFWM